MGGKKELSGETEVVRKKILVVVRRGLRCSEGGPYYTGREGKAGKFPCSIAERDMHRQCYS